MVRQKLSKVLSSFKSPDAAVAPLMHAQKFAKFWQDDFLPVWNESERLRAQIEVLKNLAKTTKNLKTDLESNTLNLTRCLKNPEQSMGCYANILAHYERAGYQVYAREKAIFAPSGEISYESGSSPYTLALASAKLEMQAPSVELKAMAEEQFKNGNANQFAARYKKDLPSKRTELDKLQAELSVFGKLEADVACKIGELAGIYRLEASSPWDVSSGSSSQRSSASYSSAVGSPTGSLEGMRDYRLAAGVHSINFDGPDPIAVG